MAFELAVDSLKESEFRCYWKLEAKVNLNSGRKFHNSCLQ